MDSGGRVSVSCAGSVVVESGSVQFRSPKILAVHLERLRDGTLSDGIRPLISLGNASGERPYSVQSGSVCSAVVCVFRFFCGGFAG